VPLPIIPLPLAVDYDILVYIFDGVHILQAALKKLHRRYAAFVLTDRIKCQKGLIRIYDMGALNMEEYMKNFEDLGKSLSLKDKVIMSIKNQIILGNLKHGSRLREEELSKAMNVSRAPIREAFNQLENEGFVKIIPRKGVFVSPINKQLIEDVFEQNEIIESAVLEKSFEKIPLSELEEMERLFKEYLKKPTMEEGILDYSKLDKSFHFILIKNCGNQMLLDYWGKLQDLIHWFRNISLSTTNFQNSAATHLEIIDAIKMNDKQLAIKRLNEHRDWAKLNAIREFEGIIDD